MGKRFQNTFCDVLPVAEYYNVTSRHLSREHECNSLQTEYEHKRN
jgi:hypothetical protein